jgi:hypothetical protein
MVALSQKMLARFAFLQQPKSMKVFVVICDKKKRDTSI